MWRPKSQHPAEEENDEEEVQEKPENKKRSTADPRLRDAAVGERESGVREKS